LEAETKESQKSTETEQEQEEKAGEEIPVQEPEK